MNAPFIFSNSLVQVPELEIIEPEMQQHLGRLFTSSEVEFIEKLWNDHFLFLLKEKYISKYFIVPGQKFSAFYELDKSVYARFFPYVFYHLLKKSVKSEIFPIIEQYKSKLLANSLSVPFWFLSGNFSYTENKCNLSYINQFISTLSDSINPLGISSNIGDIQFSISENNSGYGSFLGLVLNKKDIIIDKNDVLISISNQLGESVNTWGQNELTTDIFYQIRLLQFVQEINSNDTILKTSFQVNKNLFASAFVFAHQIQKGIVIENNDISSFENGLLSICTVDNISSLKRCCNKWGLNILEIGKITNDSHFKVLSGKSYLIDLPISIFTSITKKIEIKNLTGKNGKNAIIPVLLEKLPEPGDYRDTAWNFLSNKNLTAKEWISEKFDTSIGNNYIDTKFPSTSHIINCKGTNTAIALASLSRQDLYDSDPEHGAHIAIADITRKIVCCGGIPKMLTPTMVISTNPEYEHPNLQKLIKGLYTASRYFKLQVSEPAIYFNNHNEITNSGTIQTFLYCTGFISDKNHLMTIAFKNKGDMIYLIGQSKNDINTSLYIQSYYKVKHSPLPEYDIQAELNLQSTMGKLLKNSLIKSANSVSMGGLFKTLIDSAIIRNHGFDITSDAEVRKDSFLFGESPTRIVVSVTPHRETEFIDFMVSHSIPFSALGHVTKEEIRVDDISYGFISDFQKEYFTSPK